MLRRGAPRLPGGCGLRRRGRGRGACACGNARARGVSAVVRAAAFSLRAIWRRVQILDRHQIQIWIQDRHQAYQAQAEHMIAAGAQAGQGGRARTVPERGGGHGTTYDVADRRRSARPRHVPPKPLRNRYETVWVYARPPVPEAERRGAPRPSSADSQPVSDGPHPTGERTSPRRKSAPGPARTDVHHAQFLAPRWHSLSSR